MYLFYLRTEQIKLLNFDKDFTLLKYNIDDNILVFEGEFKDDSFHSGGKVNFNLPDYITKYITDNKKLYDLKKGILEAVIKRRLKIVEKYTKQVAEFGLILNDL